MSHGVKLTTYAGKLSCLCHFEAPYPSEAVFNFITFSLKIFLSHFQVQNTVSSRRQSKIKISKSLDWLYLKCLNDKLSTFDMNKKKLKNCENRYERPSKSGEIKDDFAEFCAYYGNFHRDF